MKFIQFELAKPIIYLNIFWKYMRIDVAYVNGKTFSMSLDLNGYLIALIRKSELQTNYFKYWVEKN